MNTRGTRACIAALTAVALFVGGCADEGNDETVRTQESSEDEAAAGAENMAIAESQVVGAPPVTPYVAGDLPAGLAATTLLEAPAEPVVGGPVSAVVYAPAGAASGQANRAIVILADREGIGLPLRGGRGMSASKARGRQGGERTANGSTLVTWEDEGAIGAVLGRGVSRQEVDQAVHGASLGQRASLRNDNRPSDLVEIASGDVWTSDSDIVGGALLQGATVTYDDGNGRVIQVSSATGDEALATLAAAAISSHGRATVHGIPAVRGSLAFDDDPTAQGVVWREGDAVIVVSGRGVTPAELLRVAEGAHSGAASEIDATRQQAAATGPDVPQGATVLFSGQGSNARWAWYLTGTDMVMAHRASDGRSRSGGVSIQDLGSDPWLSVAADEPVSEGQTFLGGTVDRTTAQVRVELANGRTVDAEIVDARPDGSVRFFGAIVPTGQAVRVVALGDDGAERTAVDMTN